MAGKPLDMLPVKEKMRLDDKSLCAWGPPPVWKDVVGWYPPGMEAIRVLFLKYMIFLLFSSGTLMCAPLFN